MNTDDMSGLLREIDAYVEDLFSTSDDTLEAALRDSRRAGLPEINVSPNQGRLLQLLTEIAGARRILEIGTLGGYSAIHFARALPDDGTMISLEIDEHHAGVARNNLERAGLSEQVEIRIGGMPVDTFTLQRGSRELRRIRLSAAQLGDGDAVEVAMAVDRTFVPASIQELKSADARELGIRLFNVHVEPK